MRPVVEVSRASRRPIRMPPPCLRHTWRRSSDKTMTKRRLRRGDGVGPGPFLRLPRLDALTHLSIQVRRTVARRTSAIVHFMNGKVPITVTYTLILTRWGWPIEDLSERSIPSLAAFMVTAVPFSHGEIRDREPARYRSVACSASKRTPRIFCMQKKSSTGDGVSQ